MDIGLEEQIRAAERAPEPGTVPPPKSVIQSLDGEIPVAVVQSALDSAGYSYVYDTKTRERSIVNNNMLRSVLGRKDGQGGYVFTTRKPTSPPDRGTTICMLHNDHPLRPKFDLMRLPTCRKANIPSEPEMRRHMKAKHRKEYENIKEIEDRERQDASYAIQKATLAALEQSLARR